MEIKKQIQYLFSSQELNNYLDAIESISFPENEPYKNWIGFNYTKEKCIAYKLYFSFFHLPSELELNKILPHGGITLLSSLLKKINQEAVTGSFANASGYAFGVKVDANLNFTYAFGFNVNLHNDDINFLKRSLNIELDSQDILSYKGNYYHFKNEKWYCKEYFYIINKEKISELLQQFNYSFKSEIPVLEIGLGNGFHPDASIDDLKLIFLDNYENVWSEFIGSPQTPDCIKKDVTYLHKELNTSFACPGFYFKKNYYSYYIFNTNQMIEKNKIKTIELFRNHKF